MIVLLALVAVGQAPPSPLDAFRANYASIKVDLDYEYVLGLMKAEDVPKLQAGERPGWREQPESRILGHWACDGQTEYFAFGSPDDVIAAAKANFTSEKGESISPGMFRMTRPQYVPKTEALFDGVTLAGHQENDWMGDGGRVINVWITGEPGYTKKGKSPFLWSLEYPFPLVLQAYFPGQTPMRSRAILDGHPMEVEVYKKMLSPVDWLQIEVSYNPARAYLPAYVRKITNDTNTQAYVDEIFLVEARPCAAGGMVPTEWYTVSSSYKDFASSYPGYEAGATLRPRGDVGVGHFKVTSFKDRKGPVALRDLDGIHSIASAGAWARLGPGEKSLTLDAIKAKLGKKLSNPTPQPLPNLDLAEVEEYRSPPPSWTGHVAIVAGVVAAVLLAACAVRWRRKPAIVLVLALLAASGCGVPDPSGTTLSAAFVRPRTLYDKNVPAVPQVLELRNDGRHSVELLRVDGNCSCRQVDQGPLPVTLRPRQTIRLDVKISTGRGWEPTQLPFNVHTPHGSVIVAANFLALPEHHLSPENASHTALREDEAWSVEVVHRAIYESYAAPTPVEIEAPDGFTLREVGTETGPVGVAPEYAFRDTTYQLTLKDRRRGLHKGEIRLKDGAGRTLANSSVVWQRVPFLSSIPDRVLLGDRPVRVFLRCPDDAVEMVKVRAAPHGISAVVSSTRELLLRVASDAPDRIEGVVEVETTATSVPPLRIPVHRWNGRPGLHASGTSTPSPNS